MKIIHTADLHLGSRFRGLLTDEKGEERRGELRTSFSRLVEYARDNRIDNILIAGDLFDSAFPAKKDRALFYNTVRRHVGISFYYLRGNHDISGSDDEGNMPNLHVFSDEWTSYDLGENIILTGIESTDENVLSKYGTLLLDGNKKNIVMMHGASSGAQDDGYRIDFKKLVGKYIDYLALGHYHSYSSGTVDSRGRYVYSGCLEGRGFDECGPKGFCVIDTDTMCEQFIPFACRTVQEYKIDISGLNDVFEISDKIKSEISCPERDLVRIILTGEILYSLGKLENEVAKQLCRSYYYVNVVDKTKRTVSIPDYEDEVSLAGEFLRAVKARDDLSQQQKIAVINAGLKALKGEKDII